MADLYGISRQPLRKQHHLPHGPLSTSQRSRRNQPGERKSCRNQKTNACLRRFQRRRSITEGLNSRGKYRASSRYEGLQLLRGFSPTHNAAHRLSSCISLGGSMALCHWQGWREHLRYSYLRKELTLNLKSMRPKYWGQILHPSFRRKNNPRRGRGFVHGGS